MKEKRLGFRVPDYIHEALKKASQKHGITKTKYVLRLLYYALEREGYLDGVDRHCKTDLFLK